MTNFWLTVIFLCWFENLLYVLYMNFIKSETLNHAFVLIEKYIQSFIVIIQ